MIIGDDDFPSLLCGLFANYFFLELSTIKANKVFVWNHQTFQGAIACSPKVSF
jgi:hypothetical protein